MGDKKQTRKDRKGEVRGGQDKKRKRGKGQQSMGLGEPLENDGQPSHRGGIAENTGREGGEQASLQYCWMQEMST